MNLNLSLWRQFNMYTIDKTNNDVIIKDPGDFKLIAITGGMASGKSWVLNAIHEHGFNIVNIDQEIKTKTDVMGLSQENAALVNTYFDFEVYTPCGKQFKPSKYCPEEEWVRECFAFNLENVRKFMFSSQDNYLKWQRYWVGLVRDSYLDKSEDGIVFVEFPMLFESGYESDFDKIIFVDTPFRKRIERFVKRGFSEEDFWKREHVHYGTDWKKAHSDFIISGTAIDSTSYHIEEWLS